MAKATKLTKKEQESLSNLLQGINSAKSSIADIELQKVILLDKALSLNKELLDLRKQFEEKYGDVTIDIASGKITANEQAN